MRNRNGSAEEKDEVLGLLLEIHCALVHFARTKQRAVVYWLLSRATTDSPRCHKHEDGKIHTSKSRLVNL